MSYILDALKKSERERSLGSLRKLHTPPQAASRAERRTVTVLLAIVVLLVLFLAVMAWVYHAPIKALIEQTREPAGESSAMTPTRDGSTRSAVIDSTRLIEDDAPVPPAGSGDRSSAAGESDVAAGGESSGGPAAVMPVSELPGEIRSRLPPLEVSAVSFSGDAERRFVMIDGGIYKEGDRLPDGIRVEKIGRDRIELSMLSEHFYILP